MADAHDDLVNSRNPGLDHIIQIPIIPQDVLACIPKHFAHRFCVIPLSAAEGGRKLIVAMPPPLSINNLDSLRYCLKVDIDPVIAPRAEILRAISEYYGEPASSSETHEEENF